MDRLTENAGGFNFGLQGRTREVALKRNHFMRGAFECTALVDTLAAYEDTGLTPDEIMEIQRHRENNQTCYVSEAAESERMRIEIAALRAELAGYKALLSSVHELADAEKFEEVTDMIDTVLPTIGRAALEGGQQ